MEAAGVAPMQKRGRRGDPSSCGYRRSALLIAILVLAPAEIVPTFLARLVLAALLASRVLILALGLLLAIGLLLLVALLLVPTALLAALLTLTHLVVAAHAAALFLITHRYSLLQCMPRG